MLLHTRDCGDTSAPTALLTDAVVENSHALDALYATFQDVFRGSRENIKTRLRAHLPRVKTAGVGTDAMPIVDLGCGRGEWLELLRDDCAIEGEMLNHLVRETDELLAIFTTMVAKLRKAEILKR